MNKIIEVRTQAELDAALLVAGATVRCCGDGWFSVRESSHVVAWGSSHVEAWGSSHVEARESSHVEARGSSHVEAWESSHVEAWELSHVVASKYVSVQLYGSRITVTGGVQIRTPDINTVEGWCDYYGVPIVDGVVTLFKGVGENYISARGGNYAPGTIPEAVDWDGGKEECGGGLHFSPCVSGTTRYVPEAKRWVACPVAVADIVVTFPAEYPDKVKAPRCCAPVYEVDRNGKAVAR